jgi:hypothetical protein
VVYSSCHSIHQGALARLGIYHLSSWAIFLHLEHRIIACNPGLYPTWSLLAGIQLKLEHNKLCSRVCNNGSHFHRTALGSARPLATSHSDCVVGSACRNLIVCRAANTGLVLKSKKFCQKAGLGTRLPPDSRFRVAMPGWPRRDSFLSSCSAIAVIFIHCLNQTSFMPFIIHLGHLSYPNSLSILFSSNLFT